MVISSTTSISPHLLVTVLLQRRLSVALLPLRSLLLFLFGLRGQHELLRYLLLGDGARLPGAGGGGESGRLITGEKRHVVSCKNGALIKSISLAAEGFSSIKTCLNESWWGFKAQSHGQTRAKALCFVTGEAETALAADGCSRLSREGDARCLKCIIETNWNTVDSVFHRAVEFPSSAISKLIHYATGLAMVFAWRLQSEICVCVCVFKRPSVEGALETQRQFACTCTWAHSCAPRDWHGLVVSWCIC